MANGQPVSFSTNFGRAEVNGIRMYYRLAGSGEPVVLLHGFPETSNAWRKVMPGAGTRDLFLSNTVRVQRKLREAGIEADLETYEGLSHAQFNSDFNAPVKREAYGEITRFFDAHLA